MFNKGKKSETACTTPFADCVLDARVNTKLIDCSEADRLREAYKITTATAAALSSSYASSKASYSESLIGPSLMDLYNICFEIRNNIIDYMGIPESIAYITQALEARECPVDECKTCRYYQPGNVEKCDTNRMLAEYLVKGEFVRGIRPKPIDKPEE